MQSSRNLSLAFLLLICTTATAAEPEQPKPAREGPLFMKTEGAFVVIPKSRDKLVLFSEASNRWNHIDITVDENAKIEPGIVGSMVVWQHGQNVYAGSGKTANWDKLTLPEQNDAKVGVDNNTIWVTDGNKLYVFGINADGWLGLDMNTGETLPRHGN